jgi:hypothetical protein
LVASNYSNTFENVIESRGDEQVNTIDPCFKVIGLRAVSMKEAVSSSVSWVNANEARRYTILLSDVLGASCFFIVRKMECNLEIVMNAQGR